jgi:hypothetical protein
VVDLWGRRWTRDELLARVGRLEQLASVQLVEAGDGAERGVRLLLFRTGAGARVRGAGRPRFAARTAALTTGVLTASAITTTSGGRT